MASDLVVMGNKAMLQTYHDFADGFESVFEVTANGTLRADRARRAAVSNWVNSNLIMIQLITGVVVSPVSFATPAYGDAHVTNANHQKMLSYYALSFTAYVRYCQTVNRLPHGRYLPITDVARVEEVDE